MNRLALIKQTALKLKAEKREENNFKKVVDSVLNSEYCKVSCKEDKPKTLNFN